MRAQAILLLADTSLLPEGTPVAACFPTSCLKPTSHFPGDTCYNSFIYLNSCLEDLGPALGMQVKSNDCSQGRGPHTTLSCLSGDVTET